MTAPAPTGVNERLAALTEAGTSVWLDQIQRSLITGGELQRLVTEMSLHGVTSNPAIFEKAILGSSDYDAELRELAGQGMSAREIYEHIAVRDVSLAADVLRPVHDATGGKDGFVSLEVAPELAHDTEGTLEEARQYWDLLGKPNVMIKIPGTPEGLPAIEEAIAAGVNVNVTLLFSVEAYAEVCEAYIRGMERRAKAGESLGVHSVASFFVSRVDTEVDKRLEQLGREDLQGTAAVANARAAYMHFKDVFRGERFAELAAAGCPVQRPLWASTGVKNPLYPETKYVDTLVAPDTVNTMPMATLLAAAEHAEITGPTADQDPSAALQALADAGIDMADVTDKLLRDGIDAFVKPFGKLIDGVESAKEAAVTGRPPTIRSSISDPLEPAIAERVKRAAADQVVQRIWRKDESLWGGPGVPELGDRLGWLTISEPMLEAAGDLQAFAQECQDAGLTDCVLLGMGGSSLGPEVLRRSYRDAGGLRLRVLDSTDAAAVLEAEQALDLAKTLFLVSSKSGGTIETMSQYRYFRSKVDDGSHFVAITDPGSPLAQLAQDEGFRRCFLNDPDIGGRYSVLSYFGLVPAALMGANVEALLHRSQVAEQNCSSFGASAMNSGLWLGLVLGELALGGRDKATFVVDEPIASFGLWVEQLIAESTGKHGKGVLPVAQEPLGEPEAYGDDRVFVHLRNADEPDGAVEGRMEALAKAGHPLITVATHGAADLGRVFFFSEFGTAVAGWVLGINPFDQPDVQAAKDATARVLEEGMPDIADASDDALRALLSQAAPPKYVSIHGYLRPSDAFDEAVAELRTAIRDATRATTTFGYGPRFLHSTGQLHKGGPPNGLFLQLVHDGEEDVDIPGAAHSFTTLKNAQAAGDLQTLRERGLPAERVRLEGDPVAALKDLTTRVKELL